MTQKKPVYNSGVLVWSRELTNNLIVNYEQHPELYRVTSKKYQNRNARQSALQEIVENLNACHVTNLNVSDITKKIHGLRTTYFHELKKLRRSESSGASTDTVYIPRWWCFEQLHFLRDLGGINTGSGSLNLAPVEANESLEEDPLEPEVIYDSPIDDLSEAYSLISPSSSIGQSRPESRQSRHESRLESRVLNDEQRESEPRFVKRKKIDSTSLGRGANKQETTALKEILGIATSALDDLQTKNVASSLSSNSNEFFTKMIAIEMNKVTDEEILDSLREEILASVSAAKRKQRQKVN